MKALDANIRLVAWETTRSCNLACVHCRGASLGTSYPDELDTIEGKRLLDEIASVGKPIIILTGGEPLVRPDIFELASYGASKGLPMALATNGVLITPEVATKIKDSGVRRVSVSIDGSDAAHHDGFRGVSGAFAGALRGIANLASQRIDFQLNTTITKRNIHQLENILDLAIELGAVAHHIFLLVPTGRGEDLAGEEINAEQYEETLEWFYERSLTYPIELKATCAPHYFRVFHQRKDENTKSSVSYALHAHSRGCLGGIAFCFVSHRGIAQPCGYFDRDCGNIRERGFRDVWENSEIFNELRHLEMYKGKCGVCEFLRVCGGCRARALAKEGDYLAEEPLCSYQPRRK
ncbi:MAG: heme b synthase [Deltaproteobacteria bacterium]|nr:heme b synthase [Deltaproteobacteria bacterium]